MIIRTPSFYKDFKCIAGDCPDSCCRGWEVDADENSLEYYKSLKNNFGRHIASLLDKDEFGNTVFRLTENKRCPFLNAENLCDMHIEIGQEHTPHTCRIFPRFINDFGGTREMGISFSCPVAAEMMWNADSFDFCEEVHNEPPVLNDIDAELYFKLVKARKDAYKIVKDSGMPLNQRLINLLDFAENLQNELGKYKELGSETDFFDVFRNPELINPEWLEKVNNHAEKANFDHPKSCENTAIYFLFRYFLTAVYDKDILSKVKMAVVGAMIPAYFGNDAWTVHLWSKETEHSDINLERYKSELRKNVNFSVKELKTRLTQI